VSEIFCNRFTLNTSKPLIMAIVNLSVDSFSNDGILDTTKAITHCERQINEGADILDIGAQSSRPGAKTIPAKIEWQRLQPILKEVVNWNIPLSVDTYKNEIIEQSIDMGIDIINNIYGFRNYLNDQNQWLPVKNSNAALVLMHMQGNPEIMQNKPTYQNVYQEVKLFFNKQMHSAINFGIDKNRLIFDPGFGFGKRFEDNLELFHKIPEFAQEYSPLMVGISRKSMLGKITDRDVGDRMAASIVSAILAIQKGAKIIRVHDVAQTFDAIKTYSALE